MGIKSRGNYPVNVCFRGECIHHNTDECNYCIGFSLYQAGEKEVKNDVKLQRLQREGNVSKSVSKDGGLPKKE